MQTHTCSVETVKMFMSSQHSAMHKCSIVYNAAFHAGVFCTVGEPMDM